MLVMVCGWDVSAGEDASTVSEDQEHSTERVADSDLELDGQLVSDTGECVLFTIMAISQAVLPYALLCHCTRLTMLHSS
jgi:hypothetical protein